MRRSSTSLALEENEVDQIPEDVRLQALRRLHVRRKAVDALIRSLELYQRSKPLKALCISISAERKCS